MRNLGRQLALLTLSGVLLVNLGLTANAELVKQDNSPLPALVATDDESPASTSSSQTTTISDTTVASLPTTTSAAAASSLAPTAGPQVDKESADKASEETQTGGDKADQPAKESAPSASSEAPAIKEDAGATEASSQPKSPAAAASDEPSAGEKDIRVLLANKNDAENDLNSPSVEKEKFSPPPSLVVVTSTVDKKEPAGLDSPVDTVNGGSTGDAGKPQVESFDNRFHYSLAGNSDSKSLSGSDSGEQATTTTTTTTTTTERPSTSQPDQEPAKKEEAPISEKEVPLEEAAKKEVAADSPKEKNESPREEAASDDGSLVAKKADSGEKVEPAVAVNPIPERKPEESSPANRLVPGEESDKSSPEPLPSTTTSAPASPPLESSTSAPATQSSSAAESSTAVNKAKEPSGEEVQTKATKPQTTPEGSAKSGGEGESVKNTQVSSLEPKKPAESADKPISVPSILAVALGTALGNAVNPLHNKNQSKEKPAIAATRNLTTSTSTTTKAPTVSSTSRKSSTDKWDRWSPSTVATPTTGAPPTRLRPLPILPSIRRRFRPYNRFSPFPFGGPDSYSPSETEFSPPVVGSGSGSRFSPAVTTSSTSRPKRRRTSTTESPARPAVGESGSDEADEEVSLKPTQDTSGTRRRGQGTSNRRRHNNHHHHHHHPHNHGESEFGGRRQHHHKQHGTRNFEREEPFGDSSTGGSPFQTEAGHPHRHAPRPISPGFSLFNSGAGTGSGFDLLNPFSGWLDEAIKPARRPPVSQAPGPSIGSPGRRPGSQPIPVEGDYNEEHGDGHHHHHQHRPHNGREGDYHDHHNHDCDHHHEHDHEHDYDHHHEHHHREPYRPNRPQREPLRPPIGGDYDPYPSSASFGRRPARPYNRRDQAELENKEQNGGAEQVSPGLYASIAPVAPRRVPSIFSPFDSLFGSLDDDLFSLRSSFIDTPAKEASPHPFDTILTSPKISMPGNIDQSARSASKEQGEDKRKEISAASKPTGEQEASSNTNGKQITADVVGRRTQRANDNLDCAGLRRGSLWCIFLSI